MQNYVNIYTYIYTHVHVYRYMNYKGPTSRTRTSYPSCGDGAGPNGLTSAEPSTTKPQLNFAEALLGKGSTHALPGVFGLCWA